MNTSMHPAISVIIPLYNKAPYVGTAIASVLASGPAIHEVIVVDDGSTDDGPEIVAGLNEPKVRLIRQKNSGVSAARNRGIRAASGDYIAFLDADDYWTPGYISQIEAMIAAYPECGMFATGYFMFNEAGHIEPGPPCPIGPRYSPQMITRFFDAWAYGNIFCTCSVVIPKKIFSEHAIFFPENENLGEDQDVWFRIGERFPVAYCGQNLIAYRVGLFPSLSKGDSGDELPPFIRRLKHRYETNAIPQQHRKGVSRLLGQHQLVLASRHLRRNGWPRTASLLFDRLSIQKPKFWLKVFLLACLPKPIRLHILDKN